MLSKRSLSQPFRPVDSNQTLALAGQSKTTKAKSSPSTIPGETWSMKVCNLEFLLDLLAGAANTEKVSDQKKDSILLRVDTF